MGLVKELRPFETQMRDILFRICAFEPKFYNQQEKRLLKSDRYESVLCEGLKSLGFEVEKFSGKDYDITVNGHKISIKKQNRIFSRNIHLGKVFKPVGMKAVRNLKYGESPVILRNNLMSVDRVKRFELHNFESEYLMMIDCVTLSAFDVLVDHSMLGIVKMNKIPKDWISPYDNGQIGLRFYENQKLEMQIHGSFDSKIAEIERERNSIFCNEILEKMHMETAKPKGKISLIVPKKKTARLQKNIKWPIFVD